MLTFWVSQIPPGIMVLAHQILHPCGSMANNYIGRDEKGVEAVSALADAFTKMPNLHTVE